MWWYGLYVMKQQGFLLAILSTTTMLEMTSTHHYVLISIYLYSRNNSILLWLSFTWQDGKKKMLSGCLIIDLLYEKPRASIFSGISIHHTATWLLLFSTTIHRAHAIWLYGWWLNDTFSIFPSLLIPSYVLKLQDSLPVTSVVLSALSMRFAAPLFRFPFFGPDSWVYLPCRSLFF